MSTQPLQMMAVDFGASSGRAVIGAFDGERLAIQEVHRFINQPVRLGNELYWDFLRLFHELKQGLLHAKRQLGHAPASISVDTWGVDYGLVDGQGRLLNNPHHYRDLRSEQPMRAALERVSAAEQYKHAGIQASSINTLFQVLAEDRLRTENAADEWKLLFMPDLFHYYLSGVIANEYTIASTSGMIDAHSRDWSKELLKAFALPTELLQPLIMPGTQLGPMQGEICAELGIGSMPVIAAVGHDTAAAVAAIPASGKGYNAFISSGTWSLMGVELDAPIVSEQARQLHFNNEGGVEGKIRLLKNIMGLWILQECQRFWAQQGTELSFAELAEMAANVPSNASYIDAGDELFLPPGNMPHRIQAYCRDRGQIVPQSQAEIVRSIVESLAFKYKQTLDEIELLTGKVMERIHIVGGGIQNRLLCQLTANICGKTVIAGPVEATSIGNLLMQAKAHGEVHNLAEIREIVQRSFPPEIYVPQDVDQWAERYHAFKCVFKKDGFQHRQG